VTLTIEPGLPARIRSGVPVMLRVHSAEEPARLATALRAARSEIAVLGGGAYRYPYVTEPISIPGGFTMLIDVASIPGEVAGTIPDTISTHLREGGVVAAEIGSAPEVGDRYDVISSFSPVAQAWLGGTRDRPLAKGITRQLDPRLVDLAVQWLRQEYRDGMESIALAIAAEVPFDWETAGAVARGCVNNNCVEVKPAARKELEAHESEYPEWGPVLHPEKSNPETPHTEKQSPASVPPASSESPHPRV